MTEDLKQLFFSDAAQTYLHSVSRYHWASLPIMAYASLSHA